MSNTGDTISIDDLEYAVKYTVSGHCDDCHFYQLDEKGHVKHCPSVALKMCIPNGCIFSLNSNKI